MRPAPVPDPDYLRRVLAELLAIPSPTGRTDEIVRFVGEELRRLGVPFELTRRGAIRADLEGRRRSPDRAIVAHLDTLGAMVKELLPNGRLRLAPIGHWSGRFAEGARVTLFADDAAWRGAIVPLKASGHVYGDEVDKQPSGWDAVELRIDAPLANRADLVRLGVNVGDFVAVDSAVEFTETGYVKARHLDDQGVGWDHVEVRVDEAVEDVTGLRSLGIDVGDFVALLSAPVVTAGGFVKARHLDDKAGVACLLAAAREDRAAGPALPVDCHLLFTISEEVGSGASHALHGDVAEMVAVDNGTLAPGQNTSEFGVTVAMMDSSGPFDYHLTRKLLRLARDNGVAHSRDVFRYYRTDAAAAVDAGNDIRTALLCFGLDASHGHERVHMDSLAALARLLTLYMLSEPVAAEDAATFRPLDAFVSD
jgi:putative aminopeptidase FrvX